MSTLTDTLIRKIKSKEKPFKLFDGGGLYLEVTPTGSKWWRWKYRYGGKENRLSLGTYPEVSLKEVRDKHYTARKQLSAGIDPSLTRKSEKQSEAGTESFEAIARECVAKFESGRAPGYSEAIMRRLVRNVFPWIGKRPISEITPQEMLAVLRRIENRGTLESAHRIKQHCGQIFRYAVSSGRMGRDPTGDLRGALPPRRQKHFAAITDPKGVGELLRAIDTYQGTFVTKSALRLLP